MKSYITLALPIKIRPTKTSPGYVIEDADGVEFFFYWNRKKTLLDYDGNCMPLVRRRTPAVHKKKAVSKNKTTSKIVRKKK